MPNCSSILTMFFYSVSRNRNGPGANRDDSIKQSPKCHCTRHARLRPTTKPLGVCVVFFPASCRRLGLSHTFVFTEREPQGAGCTASLPFQTQPMASISNPSLGRQRGNGRYPRRRLTGQCQIGIISATNEVTMTATAVTDTQGD